MSGAQVFLELLVAGLTSGVIYASLALALVVIFQSTHKINFAQGEMATFCAYIAWWLLARGTPYWVAFSATLAVAFVGGALIERLVIRPLQDASPLAVVNVFIGLLLIFNSLSGALFGHGIRDFPSPFRDAAPVASFVGNHQLGAFVVIGFVLLVTWLIFRFTRLGLAMRAAAFNPTSSRLLGVSVDRMSMIGWGGAALIGAVAGLMVAPIVYLEPHMMSSVLLYSFAGALLGGLENPWGAVAGGLIVGVAEKLLAGYVIGNDLRMTVALTLIVGVLWLKPDGLFGRRIVTRV